MSAGYFKIYDNALLKIVNDTISLSGGTVFAVLTSAAHTPNKATHSVYSDISGNIIDDAGYAPQTVTGITITLVPGATPEVLIDSANISFGTNVTLSAKYCHLVWSSDGTLAAADHLLGFADLNTTSSSAVLSSTNGNFAVNTPNGLSGIQNPN
jgi:hypothetical protein